MTEPMRFSLKRKEEPVIIEAEDGSEKTWTLRELSGEERNKFLNQMKSRMKVGVDGGAIVKNFDGFHSALLVLSLVDDAGEPVGKDVIEAMPSTMQGKLFKKAQKLSGLDNAPDDEDAEKND